MPFVIEDAQEQPAPASGGFVIEDAPLNKAAGAVNDTVNKTGTALYRGLANILGTPSDLAQFLNSNGPKPQSAPLIPGSREIKDFIFNKVGVPEVNAESVPGRIAQGGVEGIGSALPLMAGSPGAALQALYAFSSGAGSAGANELNIDPKEHPVWAKLAPILGAILPPAAIAGGRALFPSYPQTIKNAVENSPNLLAAQETQRLGNKIGVPVTGPEALGDPKLLRIQSLAEQSDQGAALREIMRNRPDAQRAAIPAGPSPREAGAAVKDAANKSITTLTNSRSQAVKPFYEAASKEAMPATSLNGFIDDIDEALSKVGTESQIGKELAAYKGKVLSAVDDTAAKIGPLDAIYKEIRDRAGKSKFEPGALDNEVKGILKPLNRQLGDILSRHNENIAYGRAVYSEMTPPISDLKNSAIGDIAQSKKAMAFEQASTLLGSAKARPDEVFKAMSTLQRADAEAVPKLIGSYLDSTMDAASKRLASGTVENAGGKFYTAIAGTPYAQANLRAAFNTLPDGQTRWRSLENTLRVFEANSRRLPVGSPTVDKGQIVSELTGGSITQPLNTFSEMLDRLRYGRNLGKLAELFARTDSVEQMRAIAGLAPGSPKARIAVNTFLNANRSALPSRGEE